MTDSRPTPAPDDSALQNTTLAVAGHQRYVPLRMLGQGAMGAVHLVRDRETGEQLALKKLLRMDVRSVLRLKREFRALADMSHPNLVKLYELGQASDASFIAMEYVPGPDLNAYLGTDRLQTSSSRIESAVSQLAAYRSWLDDVLVPAFHQLASGVCALHRAGMLHRDLKPSNVLVANGRVVVLDFGLVRELDPNAPAVTEEGSVSGTPAYMAPEQALGRPLTEASDWYAFGVMLYEALTGELPFDGSVLQLVRLKLERDPAPPGTLNGDIPPRLSALCTALLARDPSARPSGSEVLRLLEPVRALPARASLPSSGAITVQAERHAPARAAFFGRKTELAALCDALREAKAGQSRVVHVRGVSGAGKTSLVEHFVDQVEQQASALGTGEVLVLRSRCYEREAMPFKALDGVIDALSRHLTQLDDLECSHLLPARIAALTQLFPVLGRPRAVQRLLASRTLVADAMQNRQLAEAALRELVTRLATQCLVVVWIDDLQWGDVDSTSMIKGWLTHPLDVPLLLVLSYRADEVDTSECLQSLLSAETTRPARFVSVEALAKDDVHALCRSQLGASAEAHEALVEHIVRESQGSPFLATQLTALVQARLSRGDRDPHAVSLSDLIEQSKALLPTDALHLLYVLAIAARPIAPNVALRAAGVSRGGRELVHALRTQLLVRTRDVAGVQLLEVYHDRVREGVQESLPASELERLHASLLSALENSGQSDPDWLHAHALGAKQRDAALRHGLAAAERAMNGLAFGHAAELYARCLELSDGTAAQRRELLRKLADALANSGHGPKAADAYLEASKLASGAAAIELMRLSATHLLSSGRFAEGEAMLERVRTALGLRMPKSRFGLWFVLLCERLWLAVRGRRFEPRSEAEIAPAKLVRLNALRQVLGEMTSIDPLRAKLFQARLLRWSLEAGEPMRMLDALGNLAIWVAARRTLRAERRADALLVEAKALAHQVGSVAARVSLLWWQLQTSWTLGRHQAALACCDEVERLSSVLEAEHQQVSYFMRFNVTACRISALYALGDYRSFASALSAALEEARSAQNVPAQLWLASSETFLDDIQDRPEHSIARLELQRAQLPQTGFGAFRGLHMLGVMHAGCVTGRYAWARRFMEIDWPRHRRSTLGVSLESRTRAVRLRLLLAQYSVEGAAATGSLARFRSEIDELERVYRNPVAKTAVCELRAWVALLEQNHTQAVVHLQRAIEAAVSAAEAERMRYLLGTLIGGSEGATLCAQSEAALRDRGVVNPVRYVRRSCAILFPEP